MKKLLTLTLVAAMLTGMIGCGDSKDSSESSKTESSSSAAADSAKDSKTESVKQTDAPKTDSAEEDYHDLGGVELLVPAGFEKEKGMTDITYSGTLDTADTVYYNLMPYPTYSDDHAADTYTYKNVPDILQKFLYKSVHEFFPSYEKKFAFNVTEEKECEVMGKKFLRRTGTAHTEYLKNETHDIPFVAYYGIVDLTSMYYNDVPTAWMFFSDAKDSATVTNMEAMADKVAETIRKAQ